jgi:hypothetical protein
VREREREREREQNGDLGVWDVENSMELIFIFIRARNKLQEEEEKEGKVKFTGQFGSFIIIIIINDKCLQVGAGAPGGSHLPRGCPDIPLQPLETFLRRLCLR